MRKIIIEKSELNKTLEKISKQQTERRTFMNVTVNPYKGQRHPNEPELITITIG